MLFFVVVNGCVNFHEMTSVHKKRVFGMVQAWVGHFVSSITLPLSYQVMGTWIYIVGFSQEGKGTLGKVDPILYYLMSLGSWDLPYMGDSIWDQIVTPKIQKELRMFCWPSTLLFFVLPFCRRSQQEESVNFRHNFQKTVSNTRLLVKLTNTFLQDFLLGTHLASPKNDSPRPLAVLQTVKSFSIKRLRAQNQVALRARVVFVGGNQENYQDSLANAADSVRERVGTLSRPPRVQFFEQGKGIEPVIATW